MLYFIKFEFEFQIYHSSAYYEQNIDCLNNMQATNLNRQTITLRSKPNSRSELSSWEVSKTFFNNSLYFSIRSRKIDFVGKCLISSSTLLIHFIVNLFNKDNPFQHTLQKVAIQTIWRLKYPALKPLVRCMPSWVCSDVRLGGSLCLGFR